MKNGIQLFVAEAHAAIENAKIEFGDVFVGVMAENKARTQAAAEQLEHHALDLVRAAHTIARLAREVRTGTRRAA